MRTQSEMATMLLRSALTRGLSKADAIDVTKSVLSAFDLPAYSWAQEQALYDNLKTACLVRPLAALAKTLKAEDDVRAGGATAALVGTPRGRVGGATESVNTRPAANPGKGVTPVAHSPVVPGVFAPDTVRALALLDVAKKAQRKPASVAKDAGKMKPVTKAAGRREFLVTSAGVRQVDPATSTGLNLFR